jgi:Fe-S-cluster containining protein
MAESERWYEAGLPFECTACGACCRSHGDYSHVYLREEEVVAIAEHLGRDPVQFLRDELVVEEGWITLRPDLPRCQFLTDEGRCGIYPVRPVQCRTWPFWDVNLDPDVWRRDVNAICPGSRRGPLHDADRIDAIARATEAWYDGRLAEWPGLEP